MLQGFHIAFPGCSRSTALNSALDTIASGNPLGARGPSLKKNLGRENDTSACEKGPERADKAPPSPDKKRPRGPCNPVAARISRQNPGSGGDQPSAREALPLALTRARGGRDHPIIGPDIMPTSARKPTRASRKGVRPQNKKGKNKDRHEKQRGTLAASRPRKGPQKGGERAQAPPNTERIQEVAKTPGAQNGTPTKRQKERTHGQNGR